MDQSQNRYYKRNYEVDALESSYCIRAENESASQSHSQCTADVRRNNCEEVGDDGRGSKAHLTSWQYIANKRSGHGQYQYQVAR